IAPYLNRPRGLEWDSSRAILWTVDRPERQLVRLYPDGAGKVSYPLFRANGESLIDPTDLAVVVADIWVTDRIGARVARVNLESEAPLVLQDFPTTPAGIVQPAGIAFDTARQWFWVSDDTQPIVAAFTLQGDPIAAFDVPDGVTLADLSWEHKVGDASADRLWAVSLSSPGQAHVYRYDADEERLESVVLVRAEAAILQNAAYHSIACQERWNGNESSRFWLLERNGTLIQGNIGAGQIEQTQAEPVLFNSTSLRELAFLRRIVAATLEPSGTLLLGDGGLTATVARVTPTGIMAHLIPINRTETNYGMLEPLAITGLARDADSLYILDGANEVVRVYTPEGDLIEFVGSEELTQRRPRGLHVDEEGNLYVGTAGRILAFDSEGDLISENPFMASAPPASISVGRNPEEMLLFSARRRTLFWLREQGGLRKALVAGDLPADFIPMAASAGSLPTGDLILTGAGDPSVLIFQISLPPTAVDHWRLYR
ncbi:hypothetical protein HQ520_17070, partial [bacterium]|nr:hypothetical protein [bacterium]